MEQSITETQSNPGDVITTSVTVPRALWDSLKIEAIRQRTSAQQLFTEAVGQFLASTQERAKSPESALANTTTDSETGSQRQKNVLPKSEESPKQRKRA